MSKIVVAIVDRLNASDRLDKRMIPSNGLLGYLVNRYNPPRGAKVPKRDYCYIHSMVVPRWGNYLMNKYKGMESMGM